MAAARSKGVLACAMAVAIGASLAGCKDRGKQPDPGAAPATPQAAATPAPAPMATLQDVAEHTPTYLVGITYPKGVDLPAPLAAAMRAFAESARTRLVEAAKPRKAGEPGVPYDMSLEFRELAQQNSRLLVISADGSIYTGGQQGEPLIRRFNWDRQRNALLTPKDLIPSADGWKAISDSVRETLLGQMRTRMEEDKKSPEEVSKLLKDMQPLVDKGTLPDAANFSEFEPLLDAQGRAVGLTFVFAPYEVAGYADGVQRADVPAAVLLPYIAQEYRGLFQ